MQSVEQLRDRLAELMGWRREGVSPWRKDGYPASLVHPITPSLDWLAAHGLPTGCYLLRLGYAKRFGVWEADISHGCVGSFDPVVSNGQGNDAVHGLLAACVAAWEAQNERSGT